MPEKIVFVTGSLAEPRLQRLSNELGNEEMEITVWNVGVKVAALMTTKIVEWRLTLPEGTDRVVMPGRFRGDLERLSDFFGTRFERGPAAGRAHSDGHRQCHRAYGRRYDRDQRAFDEARIRASHHRGSRRSGEPPLPDGHPRIRPGAPRIFRCQGGKGPAARLRKRADGVARPQALCDDFKGYCSLGCRSERSKPIGERWPRMASTSTIAMGTTYPMIRSNSFQE